MLNSKWIRYCSIVVLLFFSINIAYPKQATASPLVFLPEAMEMIIAGLGVKLGIEASTELGKSVVATRFWENLPERMHDKLADALAYGVAGVAMINLTRDDMADLLGARDATVQELDAETEYTIYGEPSTPANVTGNVTVQLQRIEGMFTIQQHAHWQNNIITLATSYPDGSNYNSCPAISFSSSNVGGQYPVNYTIYPKNGSPNITVTGWIPSNNETGTYDFDAGMSCQDGVVTFYGNGLILGQVEKAEARFDKLYHYQESGSYMYEPVTTAVLEEGLDYSYIMDLVAAVLEQNSQLMSMIGSNVYIDTATGEVSQDIPLPGTVVIPEVPATDLTGVTSWLSTIWNSMVQGIGGIGTKINTMQTAVNSITAAPTAVIDWSPFHTMGTGFSSVFPFSLPWDINRILGSFESSEWNGIIPISAHSTLANFDFEISFAWFDGIRTIAKGLEVVCFDIGLIFVTRKLLGGAS